MISTIPWTICDVHRLLDYDCTPRPCTYCPLCDAWICQECSPNIWRRAKAAAKRLVEPGFKGDYKYTEELIKQGELK